jgi:hypothetical protein
MFDPYHLPCPFKTCKHQQLESIHYLIVASSICSNDDLCSIEFASSRLEHPAAERITLALLLSEGVIEVAVLVGLHVRKNDDTL